MKLITQDTINTTCKAAADSDRLRMNYNIHEAMDEPVHKMVMALQPGTELPIHRHLHPEKKETFIIMQGAMNVVIYNDNKTVKQRVELSHRSANLIAEIEPNDWHTLEILEPDTVFIEVKKGPYIPFSEIDLLK